MDEGDAHPNRRLEEQTRFLRLQQRIALAAHQTTDDARIFQTCVDEVCAITGWPIGHLYKLADDGSGTLVSMPVWHLADPDRFATFKRVSEDIRFAPGVGLPGRVLRDGAPAWIRDVYEDTNFPRAKLARENGLRAGFAFPVPVAGQIAAVLEFFCCDPLEPDPLLLSVMVDVGTQLGHLIERNGALAALRESEERFRSLIEGSIQGILIHRGRKALFANQAYADILGYDSPSEMLALESVDCHDAPYERARMQAYREARLAGGDAPTHYEYDAVRRDGSIVTLQNVVRVVNWDGRDALQRTVVDITERKRAEAALRVSEQRFKDFAGTAADWFWEVDKDFQFTHVTGGFEEIIGLSSEQILGRRRHELLSKHVPQRGQMEQHFEDLDNHRAFRSIEYEWVCPDGKIVVLRNSAKPIFDQDGSFQGYRGAVSDVTEAHRLSERLSYHARHDALTGLVNRWEFENRLRRLLNTVRSEPAEHAFCYLDLDQFKVVNDSFGHIAGDELLRQVATLLNEKIRKRDTLARLGGDEFGVLMEHCSLEQAQRVAVSLREAVEAFRFAWESRGLKIGVSIGLVPITETSESMTGVLSAADSACYAAKEQGRNRIHVYHDDDETLGKRRGQMRWVSTINRALEENRFRLHYQPIRSLSGGEQRPHYELLLRMKDEHGGTAQPSNFLAAAERYDLAVAIDRWVVRAALVWLANHRAHLERLHLCAINLSGHSLADERFIDFVIGEFERTGVPPEKLCFEVTETAAIANLADAVQFMVTLQSLGCRFALDDFGSGLSSFAYLKTLPVDFLKIDGLFVRDAVRDPTDLAMVKSIHEIGKMMGKRTIAESVESAEILEKIGEIGVDYAQGFGVGRPRPIEEIA